MVKLKLYVEGGGDSKALDTACRHGFAEFLKKAGMEGKMPRIVACGSRRNAYDSFCTSLQSGENAILLVDSEAAISANTQAWHHLLTREGDKWKKPAEAEDNDCHLMVQCMENWFLADRETLKSFFGRYFRETALPHSQKDIESIEKNNALDALRNATKDCGSLYKKGDVSYKLLRAIDANQVVSKSPRAAMFINALKEKMAS